MGAIRLQRVQVGQELQKRWPVPKDNCRGTQRYVKTLEAPAEKERAKDKTYSKLANQKEE